MSPSKKLLRKNKATVQTLEKILSAISQGLTQRDAATLAGISEDTLSLWKRDSDFSEQIRQKEIEYKLSHIENITVASKKSWQASAWILERKFKDEYSLKTRLDVHNTHSLEELTAHVKQILTPKRA